MGWRVGVVLALAGLAAACGGAGNDDERFKLIARDRDFSSGVADIDKVLSFYAADASLCLPGVPIATGLANIRSAAQKFAAAPGFSIEWEPTDASVSSTGDLGYIKGTYRMTTTAAGRSTAITGDYLEVWKKSGGGWKIAAHFFHAGAS
jgi:ketosteroid isomerase-like protein